ncbi:PAN domain-containing protein, partial [Frankia sp. RB7]|nr:PAN domain-containing protein [Frankia sp. RB7]
AAGTDVPKLKRLVDDCKKASCAVLSEANRRLADAQAAVEAAAREQQFRHDLAAAGTDIPKLKRIVDDCKKASCAVLSEANRRLADAQAAVEAAAREQQFRNDLEAAGTDVPKLKRIVDDCKKASCAVFSEAIRRLADAQAAVEAAMREQQFRNDLAAAGTDVPKLKRLVDDCKKASCAVLSEANRRLADAQAAVETAAREQQFRNDLAAAGTDISKLKRLVDDCKKASCAVLSEANRRLADAQAAVEAAMREQQFRNDLAAAGTDIPKLKRLVDDCKKASCAVLSEASRRLADAQAAVDAAMREQQFRNDLEAAGTDISKLKRLVDDCKKAFCAVLSEANRRLADAQAAVEAAMREQQFRNDLAAAGTDIPKLKRLVDDCKKASCAVLYEASRRLADAQTAVEAAMREQQFRNDLEAAGTDISKLKRLVDDCKKASCAVLSEASRRLADAQVVAVEAAMRELKFRNDLEAAGNDVERLSRFVDECRKEPCSVLDDAIGRLSKAKELVRPAQVRFATSTNYDMYGGDIDVKGDNGTLVKFVKSDATTCLANCRANRYCIAFVFDKWNSACYLKKQLSALTQTPRSDTSIRTDQQPFFETAKPHTCPYPNSSMRGNSISNFKSQSTEYCKRQCEDEKRCVAYMFQKRDGECTLLNSVSDRTRSDPAFDSGERTQNPNPC